MGFLCVFCLHDTHGHYLALSEGFYLLFLNYFRVSLVAYVLILGLLGMDDLTNDISHESS